MCSSFSASEVAVPSALMNRESTIKGSVSLLPNSLATKSFISALKSRFGFGWTHCLPEFILDQMKHSHAFALHSSVCYIIAAHKHFSYSYCTPVRVLKKVFNLKQRNGIKRSLFLHPQVLAIWSRYEDYGKRGVVKYKLPFMQTAIMSPAFHSPNIVGRFLT